MFQPIEPASGRAQPPTQLAAHSRQAGLSEWVDETELNAARQNPASLGHGPIPLSALMRRKWLILSLFVLISGVSVPMICVFVEPMYSARAVVRVRPVVGRILYQVEENAPIPDYTSYVNTQVQLIRDSGVIGRVLDRPELKNSAWFRERPFSLTGTPPDLVGRLLEALVVQPRPKTELIDVSMEAARAQDAANIVNAVVAEYMKDAVAEMNSATADKLRELEKLRQQLQSRVKSAQTRRYQIVKDDNKLSDDARVARLTAQFDGLYLELGRLTIEQNVREARIKDLEKYTEASETSDSADRSSADRTAVLSRDAVWAQIHAGLNDARDKLDQIRSHVGDQHRDVAALKLKIQQLGKRLKERESALESLPMEAAVPEHGDAIVMTPSVELRRLRSEREVANKRIKEHNAFIKRHLQKLNEAGRYAQEFALATEELNEAKAELELVRQRINAQNTEIDAPRERIMLASEARASSTPSRDRRLLLSVLAVGAALMLAVGAGYVRTTSDSAIYEARDVVRLSDAPFLGQLPHVRGLLPATDDTTAQPALLENLRMVRTALLRRLPGGAVVTVTSAEPDAGKTSVALLLSRSLRRLGKTVLLVDADIRQSALSASCDSLQRLGLCEVLMGRTETEDAIVSVSSDELAVMPAGGTLPGCMWDVEMLANGVFGTWLQRSRQKYDYVVLDTPPILSAADARILAAQSDGTIIVLRASHSCKRDAADALADLAVAGARLVGTVLTGAEPRHAVYQYALSKSDIGQEPA